MFEENWFETYQTSYRVKGHSSIRYIQNIHRKLNGGPETIGNILFSQDSIDVSPKYPEGR